MSSISQDIVNGWCCQVCLVYFEEPTGKPETCISCGGDKLDCTDEQGKMSPVGVIQKHKKLDRDLAFKNVNRLIRNLRSDGRDFSYLMRTDVHYSFYLADQRIDYYPGSTKYHVVKGSNQGDRGVVDPITFITLFD